MSNYRPTESLSSPYKRAQISNKSNKYNNEFDSNSESRSLSDRSIDKAIHLKANLKSSGSDSTLKDIDLNYLPGAESCSSASNSKQNLLDQFQQQDMSMTPSVRYGRACNTVPDNDHADLNGVELTNFSQNQDQLSSDNSRGSITNFINSSFKSKSPESNSNQNLINTQYRYNNSSDKDHHHHDSEQSLGKTWKPKKILCWVVVMGLAAFATSLALKNLAKFDILTTLTGPKSGLTVPTLPFKPFSTMGSIGHDDLLKTNPLMHLYPQVLFPPYGEIKAEHVEPAITKLLEEAYEDLEQLEKDVQEGLKTEENMSEGQQKEYTNLLKSQSWSQTSNADYDSLNFPTSFSPKSDLLQAYRFIARNSEIAGDRLSRAWRAANHLKSVNDHEALRNAVKKMQPKVIEFGQRSGQSESMYKGWKAVGEGMKAQPGVLSKSQQRIVRECILGSELSGVALQGEQKEKFNKNEQRLGEISTQFGNNLLDATKNWQELLTKKSQVEGLPESAKALLAQQARKKYEKDAKSLPESAKTATSEEGPWLLTLDIPAYVPYLEHSRDREMREKIFHARAIRASNYDTELVDEEGKGYYVSWKKLTVDEAIISYSPSVKDNAPIILEILKLRKENAQILGYKDHTEVSFATKMANLDTAQKLIEDLRVASHKYGEQELAQLKKFAVTGKAESSSSEPMSATTSEAQSSDSSANPLLLSNEEDLRNWDIAYYSERQKEALFDYKEEDLKPYFSLPMVQKGLFALISRLFGVEITQIEDLKKFEEESKYKISLWHPDVRVYMIKKEGKTIAYFYLDPYSRPETKRGGAWMSEAVGRTTNKKFLRSGYTKYGIEKSPNSKDADSLRLPVAHLVCNQNPPLDGQPSLMTLDEVSTLFHETGHALQHMLTQENEAMAAGINLIEWDAVELPSQFMENWIYNKKVIDSMGKHWKTGEKIPDDLWDKVVKAKNYRAGSGQLRQLNLAQIDISLHNSATFDPSSPETNTDSIWSLYQEVAKPFALMPPLEYLSRFLCGFSHIFNGGYSSGYYSYAWAEVLSSDCYGAFEEVESNNEEEENKLGRKFAQTILGLGGGEEPLEVFKKFRGREPKIDAMLRHKGLVGKGEF